MVLGYNLLKGESEFIDQSLGQYLLCPEENRCTRYSFTEKSWPFPALLKELLFMMMSNFLIIRLESWVVFVRMDHNFWKCVEHASQFPDSIHPLFFNAFEFHSTNGFNLWPPTFIGYIVIGIWLYAFKPRSTQWWCLFVPTKSSSK